MQAEGDSPAVLAQDLKQLRDASRTQAVLWTMRRSYCTLQIVQGIGTRVARAAGTQPETAPLSTRIQAVLIMPGGERVAPTGQWETPAGNTGVLSRQTAHELLYAFPLQAGREAVAIALIVDGQEHMQRLEKVSL